MSRPPVDVNKLAARAQGAARALNPPERQATEAIVRRATQGGTEIRLEATKGFLGNERYELPGILSGGGGGSGGDITAATHYRGGVVVDGYDASAVQRWALYPSGSIQNWDAAGVLRSTLNTSFLGLYDSAGVLIVNMPNNGSARLAYTPTVGPFGSNVPVALAGNLPMVQLPTAGAWLSAHDAFPMRNPASAAFALAANTMYGTLMVWPERAEADQVGFWVTTAGAAGSNAQVAVYRLNPADQSLALYFNTGNIAVTTTGWKPVTYGWDPRDSGIYVAFVNASAAVSLNGIAANALAASPFPATNYNPATAYSAGSAPPIPQGVSRAQAFGTWPASIVLAAANVVATALPVVWVFTTPKPA